MSSYVCSYNKSNQHVDFTCLYCLARSCTWIRTLCVKASPKGLCQASIKLWSIS